jgi:HK97 family phage major capsid protein
MPEPGEAETQEAFMERCISMVMEDGTAEDNDQAVAICMSKWEGKSISEAMDTVITFGEPIKRLGSSGSLHTVGGYLIRFTDETQPDLTGEFFHKETDFDMEFPNTSKTWFNHCLPVKDLVITRSFKAAELTVDEIGVFAKGLLDERDEYEKMILEFIDAKKIGWSSGTAGHLIKRTPLKNGINRIDRWPLGLDASYTHTPAEPRNGVLPIKSLIEPQVKAAPGAVNEGQSKVKQSRGETMELTQEELQKIVNDASSAAATKAVEALANEPAIKSGGVAVVEDEADRAARLNPFKTFGDFIQKVVGASYGQVDKRLFQLRYNEKAATGLNEAIPSQGGYLVHPQFQEGIINKMYAADPIMGAVRWFDIAPNSNRMVFNAINETSRADGSRQGGILGYWLGEADSKTATKPAFRQIELVLQKVAALVYATDELLEDAVALESYLSSEVPAELNFKVANAIYNGDGVAKPLGWMSSPALVSVTRDTGSRILGADLFAMWARLWPACRKNAIWLVDVSAETQLHQLYLQTGIAFPFYSIDTQGVQRLFGRPVYTSEHCAALNTTGDIMLVDPTQYFAIRKGAIQSASSIHVAFLTDESVLRFIYRCDGEDSWSSAVTPKSAGNSLSDCVVLGSAT